MSDVEKNNVKTPIAIGAAVLIALMLIGFGYATFDGTIIDNTSMTQEQAVEQGELEPDETNNLPSEEEAVTRESLQDDLEELDAELEEAESNEGFDEEDVTNKALGLEE